MWHLPLSLFVSPEGRACCRPQIATSHVDDAGKLVEAEDNHCRGQIRNSIEERRLCRSQAATKRMSRKQVCLSWQACMMRFGMGRWPPQILQKHGYTPFLRVIDVRTSYKAPMFATIRLQLNNMEPTDIDRKIGEIPIMLRSVCCHLHGMTSDQLVKHGEEPWEFGGYFISVSLPSLEYQLSRAVLNIFLTHMLQNGNEKAVRLLSLMRRNYIIGLVRSSFTKRGTQYTKFGCMLRCVRDDCTGNTLVLHYLNTGNCTISIKIRKQEYLVPAVLILKALTGANDHQIFMHVTQGDTTNTFVSDRVEVRLCEAVLPRLFVVVHAALLPNQNDGVNMGHKLIENRSTKRKLLENFSKFQQQIQEGFCKAKQTGISVSSAGGPCGSRAQHVFETCVLESFRSKRISDASKAWMHCEICFWFMQSKCAHILNNGVYKRTPHCYVILCCGCLHRTTPRVASSHVVNPWFHAAKTNGRTACFHRSIHVAPIGSSLERYAEMMEIFLKLSERIYATYTAVYMQHAQQCTRNLHITRLSVNHTYHAHETQFTKIRRKAVRHITYMAVINA
jgi:hypothetical protein